MRPGKVLRVVWTNGKILPAIFHSRQNHPIHGMLYEVSIKGIGRRKIVAARIKRA